jgi:hypothetical protein
MVPAAPIRQGAASIIRMSVVLKGSAPENFFFMILWLGFCYLRCKDTKFLYTTHQFAHRKIGC